MRIESAAGAPSFEARWPTLTDASSPAFGTPPTRARAGQQHLVDATIFYAPHSGGVRRYLLAKHDWLARASAATHTLVVPGPGDAGRAGDILTVASPRVAAGYRLPVQLDKFRRTLEDLRPTLLEAGDPYSAGWAVARAAENLRVPAVAFCHSDVIGLAHRAVGRRTARVVARCLRALYGRFHSVLAPSAVVARRLADAGIERVVIQPLGVDAATFAPSRARRDLRAELGLPPRTRLLVFAGRLAPEKNIPELIETVELLGNPYHLVLVGGTRRERRGPRVTLLPYEADAVRVAALIAGCDAFVHAGRQETFGLVVLEALACGLPVVAYEGGALAELVDSRVGALAPPGGPPALAEAIAGLFTRDLAALGARARRRILEHYTWDACFARQLRHYAALLGDEDWLPGRAHVRRTA